MDYPGYVAPARHGSLRSTLVVTALAAAVIGCSPFRRPAPTAPVPSAYQEGIASWYGQGFRGRVTASGEVFDERELTAAHPTLPFGAVVRVVHVANGRDVVVRINDRGPAVGGRIIDLSRAAAEALGIVQVGLAPVRLFLLELEPP
jgi:rare lipoprotein A